MITQRNTKQKTHSQVRSSSERLKRNFSDRQRHQSHQNYYSRANENRQPTQRYDGGVLKIIPLGGCEEVGRNMTVFEYGNDIVVIDIGLQFPEEDMPGIDYVIPNTDYLRGKEKKIRAVIFTHGHLDHIGAVPFIVEKLGNPILIGSNLTIHMIKARVEDYHKGGAKNLKTKIVNDYNQRLSLGKFIFQAFPVSHSIMDAMGIILETPVASVVHPGDWKIEHDPIGRPLDYRQLSKVRKPSILMLESLGVNYLKPPVSEKIMYKNLETIIANSPGRVVIGTFSSMVERIKVVLEIAEKHGKKVAVDGFSMKTNVEIAKKLGYIKFDLKNLILINQVNDYPDKKIIVMCTGAQGEENAVLARIANGEHRHIKFKKSDTVIFSSSVIPGNERTVQKLKDLIYRQSDNVIHSDIMDVHAGGHATASDVREIIKQIKPDYLVPVYANHFMLKEVAKIGYDIGYDDKHVFVPDNGSVLEFNKRGGRVLETKVVTDPVFVDGLGVTNLQHVVLRDRQILAGDGMIVVIATVSKKNNKLVHNPDIISRGFVYLKENKELIEQVRKKVRKIFDLVDPNVPLQDDYLKNKIRNDVGQFVFSKTEKRPMVLPVVIQV